MPGFWLGLSATLVFTFGCCFGAALAAAEKKNRGQFAAQGLGSIGYLGTSRGSGSQNAIWYGCPALDANKTHYFVINNVDKSQQGKRGYFLVEIFLSRKVEDRNDLRIVEFHRNKGWIEKLKAFEPKNIYTGSIKAFFDLHKNTKPEMSAPGADNDRRSEERLKKCNCADWHAKASSNPSKTSLQLSGDNIYRDRYAGEQYYIKYRLLWAKIFDPGEQSANLMERVTSGIIGSHSGKFVPFYFTAPGAAQLVRIRVTAPLFDFKGEYQDMRITEGEGCGTGR